MISDFPLRPLRPIRLGECVLWSLLLFALSVSTAATRVNAQPPAGVAEVRAPAVISAAPAASDSSTSNLVVVRDPTWAVPLERPGLPNLHKVDDNLYRGAQPTAEGFRELKAMGIKTVINLRKFHSDRKLLGGTGLRYVSIGANAWHSEDEDVVEFLKTVSDTSKGPFFVHCQHGADRTGTMNAIYRMVMQGWSKDRAIEEMTRGGYGFHSIWKNLIRYIQKLDIDKIRRKAGIPATGPEDDGAKH